MPGLAKLPRLAKIPRAAAGRVPLARLDRPAKPQMTEEQKWAPPPGSKMSSAEDNYGHWWLSQRDPYWIPQVDFWELGIHSQSSIDDYHPLLRLAYFFDGVHWHDPKETQDLILRTALESIGVRWYALPFSSFEQFKNELPNFYRVSVGG